jgi:hypothetical protein
MVIKRSRVEGPAVIAALQKKVEKKSFALSKTDLSS